MPDRISDLARRLAREAEVVCRHYLSNGRRQGRYWLVGDVDNAPGRSLYVRLEDWPGRQNGAGRWTDSATGQNGDLLDLIVANRRLASLREGIEEARTFLSLPQPVLSSSIRTDWLAPTGSSAAARRLFALSCPVQGTLAETYLRRRGIIDTDGCPALRFHPRCWYRSDIGDQDDARQAGPALIAAVTDLSGTITGVQRTWLDPCGFGKASVPTPRRAMGHLLGHGVRFGVVADIMLAGEGLETVLSLRTIMPNLPSVAALSANHLAALAFPPGLRRLYVARDNDPAGHGAAERLAKRAVDCGVEILCLMPTLGDFNDDLLQIGPRHLADTLRLQLAPDDVSRFWRRPKHDRGPGTPVRLIGRD